MRYALSMFLAIFIAVPAVTLVGCDRTISETTKVHKDSSGNVTEETKKVSEDPNGNVTVTKEKTVENR